MTNDRAINLFQKSFLLLSFTRFRW